MGLSVIRLRRIRVNVTPVRRLVQETGERPPDAWEWRFGCFGGVWGRAGIRRFVRGTAQTGPESLGVLLVESVGCGPGSGDGASRCPSEAARAQPETLPGHVGRSVPSDPTTEATIGHALPRIRNGLPTHRRGRSG